jgi:hypothetical protein
MKGLLSACGEAKRLKEKQETNANTVRLCSANKTLYNVIYRVLQMTVTVKSTSILTGRLHVGESFLRSQQLLRHSRNPQHFIEPKRFITVFKTARHWSLPSNNPNTHPVPLESISTFSSNLLVFPSGLPTKTSHPRALHHLPISPPVT